MRLRPIFLGALIGGLLTGCGLLFDFGDYDTSRPAPAEPEGGATDADVAPHVDLVKLPPFAIRRAYPALLGVSIVRNGVEGAIDLTVTGLPDGVSVAPAVIAAGATSTMLTFTSTDAAPLGTEGVAVNAALAGAPQDSFPLALTVTASRLDPTFGDGGIILGNPFEILQDVVLDDPREPLVAVLAPPAGLTRDRFIIYRVSVEGAYANVLEIPQADTSGYRIASAPDGGFVIADGARGHVTSYSALGESIGGLTVLPDLVSPVQGAVRLTSDGKIALLMTGDDTTSRRVALVLRYLYPDGTPDLAFGDAGGVTFDSRDDDRGGDILATDAGLVTCITRSAAASDDSELLLVRLGADGTPDRSFADGGVTIARAGYDLACNAIAADGPGFVVAGALVDPAANGYGFVVRVGADGALDLSLGDQGLVSHSALGESLTNATAVDPDGGILSAGYAGDRLMTTSTLFLDLADGGAPNALFGVGDGGAFPLAIGASSQATAIRVLDDQRIVVAGSAEVDGGATWYVARILP